MGERTVKSCFPLLLLLLGWFGFPGRENPEKKQLNMRVKRVIHWGKGGGAIQASGFREGSKVGRGPLLL